MSAGARQSAAADLRIFELIFDEANFGYRRGRSTKDALRKVWREIDAGAEWILDADLKDFFGSADQAKLLALVSQQISDGRVLRLVRARLQNPNTWPESTSCLRIVTTCACKPSNPSRKSVAPTSNLQKYPRGAVQCEHHTLPIDRTNPLSHCASVPAGTSSRTPPGNSMNTAVSTDSARAILVTCGISTNDGVGS